jgi:hypothetical protein
MLGEAPHTAMLPDLGLLGKLGPGVNDDRVSCEVTTERTPFSFKVKARQQRSHTGRGLVVAFSNRTHTAVLEVLAAAPTPAMGAQLTPRRVGVTSAPLRARAPAGPGGTDHLCHAGPGAASVTSLHRL